MGDTAKRLAGPTQLGTGATTVYTVPSSTTTTILHIIAANTTGVPAQITVSIGADAAGTRILHQQSVAGSLEIKGFIVMTATELLQAYCDTASAVTLTVCGVETT